MIIKKRRTLAFILATVLSALLIIPLAACSRTPKLSYLKARGQQVLNEEGEEVYLRGVNAGGLFVTEHWMTGFASVSGVPSDYKNLTEIFIDRFGEDKTKELWAEYRANWWSEQDFKNCAAMGMNVIRLPFTYMNVDFAAITDYEKAGNFDFSDLDSFVKKAAKYGIYTILDLHGAYGSQNGKDHSGERIDDRPVDFYSNEQLKGLTVNLWTALSEHYKDNPNVAGYDILNEPGENAGSTSKRHWDFYDRVYKAIRNTGDNHIVIFESCWNGENLPQPSTYGWQNCMYSFHHYTSNEDTSESGILSHNKNWNEKIANVTQQNFGVPLNMGEFCSYSSAAKWDYTLDLLNRSNWHWTGWTYKIWGSMAWGIQNVIGTQQDKVAARDDSYETILNKFKRLRTGSETVKEYTFPQKDEAEETTLASIFKEYCPAPAQTEKLAEGSYTFYGDEGYLALGTKIGTTDAVTLKEDGNVALTFTLSYHSSGDGSVYLNADGKNLCVFESGGNYYLTTQKTNGDAARFYPVQTGYGWAFVSYNACKYLAVDGQGTLRASAVKPQDATVFYYTF